MARTEEIIKVSRAQRGNRCITATTQEMKSIRLAMGASAGRGFLAIVVPKRKNVALKAVHLRNTGFP